MNANMKNLLGKKVIVEFKGAQVVAKLISLPDGFGKRDAIVQFPAEKRTRQVWRSKVSAIKD
jgi:hypothetical protein